MQVRTVILAQGAYACIKTPARSLDVLLNPGRGVSRGLREASAELREQAERLIGRAEFIEQAADHLDGEN